MNKLIVSSLFLAACGGGGVSTVSTPGTAQLSGTLGGAQLTPKSAYASFDATSNLATIGLFDTAGACSSTIATGARALEIQVADMSSDNTIEVKDDYTVGGSTRFAIVQYIAADGTVTSATSGIVDITKNETKGLRGTVDATFADGSMVSGSFDATQCADLASPAG
jgi:hypothetical protein